MISVFPLWCAAFTASFWCQLWLVHVSGQYCDTGSALQSACWRASCLLTNCVCWCLPPSKIPWCRKCQGCFLRHSVGIIQRYQLIRKTSARFSTLLMLASVRALRDCMDGHLPAVSRTAWCCRTCHFFKFKSLILSIFNSLFIVQKHLAQTCGSITLTDSQTFLSMSVFNGKTVKPLIYKHENMTSAWRHRKQKYLTFTPMEN